MCLKSFGARRVRAAACEHGAGARGALRHWGRVRGVPACIRPVHQAVSANPGRRTPQGRFQTACSDARVRGLFELCMARRLMEQ